MSRVQGYGFEGCNVKFEQISANEEGLCARVFVGVFFGVGAEVFFWSNRVRVGASWQR